MSGKTRNYTKIDSHNYNAIKRLIEVGITGKEIKRIMKISPSTYARIRASESLEDYRRTVSMSNKNSQAKRNAEQKTAKAEPEQKKAVVEFSEIEFKSHVGPQLNVIIELLQTINRKLGPEPKEEPKKRGFFR